jgi:hypothetical protein
MSTKRRQATGLWLLAIQDMTPQGRLAYDLKDVLHCLGPTIADYSWVVSYLECVGDDVQQFCKAAKKRRAGVPLSNDDLLAVSQKIVRTIDATILGGSVRTIKRKKDGAECQLTIWVGGGGCFLIITKEKNHVRELKKRFKKVKVMDGLKFLSKFEHSLKKEEDIDYLSVLAPSDN